MVDDRTSKRFARRGSILLLVGLAGLLSGAGTTVEASSCWLPPVSGIVVDPFREPACRWCAGNRGIEYRVAPNGPVRAAASGTVTFAGTVAGVRYVVVQLPNRWRITYGRLARIDVTAGDRLLAGSVIARSSGEFFLGLRVGEMYVDPAPHVGRLIGRARLVPIDGARPRPAPPPEPRCRVPAAPR